MLHKTRKIFAQGPGGHGRHLGLFPKNNRTLADGFKQRSMIRFLSQHQRISPFLTRREVLPRGDAILCPALCSLAPSVKLSTVRAVDQIIPSCGHWCWCCSVRLMPVTPPPTLGVNQKRFRIARCCLRGEGKTAAPEKRSALWFRAHLSLSPFHGTLI